MVREQCAVKVHKAAEAKVIPLINCIVRSHKIKIVTPVFSNRIPIDPPQQTRIVKAIAEIIQAAVDVDFFAGKAINIGAGEGATGGNGVSERIVTITGNHGLAAVEHVSDVAVAVGEIEIVSGPVAGGAAG